MSKYDNDRPVAHFRLLCVLHSYMDCIVFSDSRTSVVTWKVAFWWCGY